MPTTATNRTTHEANMTTKVDDGETVPGAHVRRPNAAHSEDDLNDAGECLAGAELPSRPGYDVVTEDGTRATALALEGLKAADNDDDEPGGAA